ncbi:MAG: helix-turn-helix domain-containing protein [Bacteroidota bacterium]|nr:helix-turn-helix domain-containing protein [Bacteroidota bacterium]
MAQLKTEKPRGVLRLTNGERKFNHALFTPTEQVGFFVEHYWIVSWDLRDQEPYVTETLPHPSVHCVIEHDRSYILGVPTKKFSRRLENQGNVFGIKFKPGAFHAFIDFPVSDLTDKSLSIIDVFGNDGKKFENTMRSLEENTALVNCAEQFLLDRLPGQDENIAVIDRIVHRIISEQDITKVDDVVTRCSISKRTLQRLFNTYVGIHPKWMIRRYRFHDAVDQLEHGKTVDLPKLALDLGYFDQPHFIKDFKALIGKSPTEYLNDLKKQIH